VLFVVGISALLLIKSIREYNTLAEQKEQEAQAYKEKIENEAREKEKANKESQEKLQQEKSAREVAEARIKEMEEYVGNGKINSVWVDHNVFDKNIKGMRIHVKFDVSNYRDAKCIASAYFEYANGEMLKSSDGRYQVSNGQVAVGQEFTPPYVSTTYNDLILFMPYDELHTGRGNYQLRFNVRLYREGGKFFAQSEYYGFNLSK
jgi:hypothetical protein